MEQIFEWSNDICLSYNSFRISNNAVTSQIDIEDYSYLQIDFVPQYGILACNSLQLALSLFDKFIYIDSVDQYPKLFSNNGSFETLVIEIQNTKQIKRFHELWLVNPARPEINNQILIIYLHFEILIPVRA